MVKENKGEVEPDTGLSMPWDGGEWAMEQSHHRHTAASGTGALWASF